MKVQSLARLDTQVRSGDILFNNFHHQQQQSFHQLSNIFHPHYNYYQRQLPATSKSEQPINPSTVGAVSNKTTLFKSRHQQTTEITENAAASTNHQSESISDESINKTNSADTPPKMPQRSPFAIQELLGLSDSAAAAAAAAVAQHASCSSNMTKGSSVGMISANNESSSNLQRSSAAAVAAAAAVSAVTSPNLYPNAGQTPFTADQHHQMTMAAASRMAYFNAHAAVAAAFLPHGGSHHHLLHPQAAGNFT